jgi:hypothetical protein
MPAFLDHIVSERLDCAEIEDRLLRLFLDRWFDARSVNRVTRRSEFPADLIAGDHSDITLVEVRPDGFWFQVIGERVRASHLRNYTGRSLDEVEPPAYRDTVQFDYRTAVREAMPIYNRITARVGERVFSYHRLLLPLSRDGRTTAWLLGVADAPQSWRDYFNMAGRRLARAE